MINEQLIDFIKQQLQKGVNREIISKELLGSNWASQDIEEGFSTLNIKEISQSNNQITHIQKNKSKFIKYYPLSVFVLLVAFIIFVLKSADLFLFASTLLYISLISPVFLLAIISFLIKNRKASIILNIIITIIIIFPIIIVGSGIITSFVLSK